MTKKIVFGVVLVALVALVTVPSASANCNPAKSAVTFGGGVTAYWLPVTAVGTLAGQAWQLGAPGTSSASVACVDFASSLFPDTSGVSLQFNLGAACNAGCPAATAPALPTLAFLAQNKTATGTEFLLATVVETPGNASGNFHYGFQGNHNMITLPSPTVISSSKALSVVTLHVGIPSIAAGLYGPGAASAVSGFNVVSALSETNPGTDASLYQTRASVASAGGAAVLDQAVTVDCAAATGLQDQWVATQISFEGGSVLSSAVSAPRRVHCLGALADPKYKVVPKKAGPKAIQN